MSKDLRTVLGDRKVKGRYVAALLRRRQALPVPARLRESLRAALCRCPRARSTATTRSARTRARPATSGASTPSASGPIGGATQPLIHWINRPTYQQVIEIQSRAAALSGVGLTAASTPGGEPA